MIQPILLSLGIKLLLHGTSKDSGPFTELLDRINWNIPKAFILFNDVPLILIEPSPKHQIKNGKLADLAPTALALMGIAIPKEMGGEILILILKNIHKKKRLPLWRQPLFLYN